MDPAKLDRLLLEADCVRTRADVLKIQSNLARPDSGGPALNMVETGGMIGSKRRAAGFTIHKHTNGTYYATDDRTGRTYVSGCASLEAITKLLRPEVDRRTVNK